MVEECPRIEPNLSTECTASTVETTVETTGILSSKGELGGYGGKEGGEPAGALDPGWARALSSRASCTLGRCAYANPDGRPNRYLGAMGCDGYHASRSTDADGRVTVRWGLCPRHREWWRRERIRQNAAKVVRMPHAGLGPER